MKAKQVYSVIMGKVRGKHLLLIKSLPTLSVYFLEIKTKDWATKRLVLYVDICGDIKQVQFGG